MKALAIASAAGLALGLAACTPTQVAQFNTLAGDVVSVYGSQAIPASVIASGQRIMTVACPDVQSVTAAGLVPASSVDATAALGAMNAVCAGGMVTTVSGVYADLQALVPYIQKVDPGFTALAPDMLKVGRFLKIHPKV
jgi:hypothetical protein